MDEAILPTLERPRRHRTKRRMSTAGTTGGVHFLEHDRSPHWTSDSSFPIWASMATRLLLTLLALLTGLVVQLSPAQARVRAEGASEIGALAAVARGERAAVSQPNAAVRPSDRRWRKSRCTVAMMGSQADCARPVLVGVDRAHE